MENINNNLEYIVSAVAMERKSKYIAFVKVENVRTGTTEYLYGAHFFKSDTDVMAQMTDWGVRHLNDCADGLVANPNGYWKWAKKNHVLDVGQSNYWHEKRMGAVEIPIPNVKTALVMDILFNE